MSLPTSWKEVNLLEVCEVNPRLTKADYPSPETIVSSVPYSHVNQNNNKILEYKVQSFSQTPVRGGWFRNNDILIATRGPENMKCALVEKMPTELGVTQHFLVLRTRDGLLPEYLLYFVQQPWFQLAARKTSIGTTHQLTIPTHFFRDIRLPLPSIEEQEFLVALFRKATLEPYRSALARARALQEALAQEIILSSNHSESWPARSLSEVCILNPPKPKTLKALSFTRAHQYSPDNVHWLTFNVKPQITTIGAIPKSWVEVIDDDILFNIRPDARSRSTVCVVPAQESVRHFASMGFQILRPTEKILPEYLAAFMRLPWLHDQVQKISNLGRLSRTLFSRIELQIPPIEEQRTILELLNHVSTSSLHDALEKATNLAQAIYREGFSGQLSRLWREATERVSTLPASSQTVLSPATASPYELFNPTSRLARSRVTAQLSETQIRVWELLCERRHPLLIDEHDSVATFCIALRADTPITPVALRRALKQLAALGLIRHMSIPNSQGTFMTAFRRCRVDDFGRSGEDSAQRDAQLFRESIQTPDKGL